MSTTGQTSSLLQGGAPYLAYLESWLANLQDAVCDPERSAILVIDVIEGFCEHGALASARVNTMVTPVVALLDAYQRAGGTHVLLPEDAHAVDAREFMAFPPHCLAGTEEARTVATVAAIEAPTWRHFPKQTINAMAEPELRAAIESLLVEGVDDLVVCGDCTDLCIYHAAMSLQLLLNRQEYAPYRDVRVIVPATAVQTYDMPVEQAHALGAQPHPGDLLHALFLHHMALNGAHIVRGIRWMPS